MKTGIQLLNAAKKCGFILEYSETQKGEPISRFTGVFDKDQAEKALDALRTKGFIVERTDEPIRSLLHHTATPRDWAVARMGDLKLILEFNRGWANAIIVGPKNR